VISILPIKNFGLSMGAQIVIFVPILFRGCSPDGLIFDAAVRVTF